MLSISPPLRGAGKGDYYLELARKDYYLEGGEPLGRWQGRAAEELGLAGTVEREQLGALLDGYDPRTGEELVRNAGKESRQNAWDLTFSAPKSVSVFWSQADPATRDGRTYEAGRLLFGACDLIQSSLRKESNENRRLLTSRLGNLKASHTNVLGVSLPFKAPPAPRACRPNPCGRSRLFCKGSSC